jgi:cytochrome c-type biogenesis protein CcmH
MLLWIILTLMTSAAAVWVSIPLLRRLDAGRNAASRELEVYRDQLAEVDRETADGLIDTEQAAAAAAEIKRRMLSAERSQSDKQGALSLGERHFAVVSVAGIVALGSVILYANSGRPDLPSVARPATSLTLGDGNQGASFRPAAQAGRMAAVPPPVAPQTPTGPSQSAPTQGQAQTAPSLGSVDDMIQRLVERLKKDPANVETWRMLGWSFFSTDRFAEAADAYAKAIALQPNNAGMLTSHGEALVRAANGEVRPDAVAAFDKALALDAKEPRARFFKGLILEQAGKKLEALDAWADLLRDAGADDTWAPDLRARLDELAGELGVDVTAKLPAAAASVGGILQKLKDRDTKSPDAATAEQQPATRGPSADDVKAAERLSPVDRTAMIRNMVDGLAERLEKSPRDADGWIQLMRSRKVLGEEAAAKAALAKALAAFSDAPQEQARIAAAATELAISR